MRKVHGCRILRIAELSLCITCWANFPSQNSPTDSSDEADFLSPQLPIVGVILAAQEDAYPLVAVTAAG